MTTTTPTTPRSAVQRSFAPLAGFTSLAILAQAITAGLFMARRGQEGWVEAHNGIGYLTVLLALATGVVGLIAYRKAAPSLAWGGVVLALLVVAQLVIGLLISDLEQRFWVSLHVPLALIVFGLTGWLAFRAASWRRDG